MPTSPAPTTTAATALPSLPPADLAHRVLASMDLAQRVGQLLMIDNPTTSVSSTTVAAVQHQHVGAVILDGNSLAGLAVTRGVTSSLENANPSRAALFMATDQEGGQVQRLKGTGFTVIPSAAQQGRLAPAALQGEATAWGRQLHDAGVNVDLGPVLDTVPAGFGSNPPIGNLEREYGHSPAAVTSHGLAFAAGLRAAGVAATAKHFPGLGRVRGNTDTTAGVTDAVTTAADPYLAPFEAAVKAGVPFVMMSTAVYTKIDPKNPAAFSSRIVTGLLRGTLGYDGVVISDDLGQAKQVAAWPIGDRAVNFIAAGGDMVLTVDASQAPAMASALIDRAQRDPAFRAQVDAAALRVLEAKQAQGLLS